MIFQALFDFDSIRLLYLWTSERACIKRIQLIPYKQLADKLNAFESTFVNFTNFIRIQKNVIEPLKAAKCAFAKSLKAIVIDNKISYIAKFFK